CVADVQSACRELSNVGSRQTEGQRVAGEYLRPAEGDERAWCKLDDGEHASAGIDRAYSIDDESIGREGDGRVAAGNDGAGSKDRDPFVDTVADAGHADAASDRRDHSRKADAVAIASPFGSSAICSGNTHASSAARRDLTRAGDVHGADRK